ncbi:MAG: radical SAM protein, partial [Desulfurococcaceae archaeon]
MVNSEINTVYKHLRKNFIRIALVYPSSYEVMSSSLAIHILYYLLNETYEEVYVERFHAGKLNNFEQEARSIETNTTLSKFDFIITS